MSKQSSINAANDLKSAAASAIAAALTSGLAGYESAIRALVAAESLPPDVPVTWNVINITSFDLAIQPVDGSSAAQGPPFAVTPNNMFPVNDSTNIVVTGSDSDGNAYTGGFTVTSGLAINSEASGATFTLVSGTPSGDASLAVFQVNGSNVSDGDSITLDLGTTSVDVVATPAASGASVTVAGGTGLISGDQNLTVTVTAQDHITHASYTVHVHVRLPVPVNIVLPALSSVSPTAGDTVSCDGGTWEGSPTLSYQWTSNSSNIPGATSDSYTATRADAGSPLACIVTGINESGSSPANSDPTSQVTAVPVNIAAPLVTTDGTGGGTPPDGPAALGDTLSVTTGDWSAFPAVTFFYEWSNQSGADGPSVVVGAADSGGSVTCRVMATNSAGFTYVTSNPMPVA